MKGVRAIQTADVVFVPRGRGSDESLALRIAQPWLAARQQIVTLLLPMTKDPEQLLPAWRDAADQIAAHLEPGKRGVYLLLGDPLFYGTFTYVWKELAERHAQIAVEIVPGITSFAAAAAVAQQVLATTSDRVAILPATYETDAATFRRLLVDFETVILLKVGTVMPQVLSVLEELGLLDHALYAERVGMSEAWLTRDVRQVRGPRPYLSLLIVRRPEGRERQ
jgi:precorrin-2/cobalt-factor-2 C20-methyltransferase